MKRTRLAALSVCATALVATACGSQGVYDIPLPGGADVGDHPMKVDIQFDDVLDLVPQSAVKLDGVPVGRVDKIATGGDGWIASVTVLLNGNVDVPSNAGAEVRQSNLLGEKFIELTVPLEDASSEKLHDGSVIHIENTRHATDIEQVLGALSLLLNGGGVAQLQPIITEVNKAVGGRESKLRSLLEQANTLVSGLEEQVDDITRALDGLDVLASRVSEQTDQIGKILDELPEGVRILEEQRPQLTAMLSQLDRLGQVGFDVINTSKNDLIRDLRALRPTLQALGEAAPDLVTAFPLIPTYPFPDSVLESTAGGYVNTWLSVDLQIGTTLSNLGVGKPDPVYVDPVGPPVPVDPTNPYYHGNGPRPGWPTISLLPLAPNVVRPAVGNVPAPGQDPFSALLDQLGVVPR
ncbi:MCE family protein [Antrihabitans stalactiti]|uniref:MCE family protein n=1 Tax=Antrihabitans stalactiti TaxID=2584121 RepID=A0A848KJ89_9NOCA|nr:MCE family protein [Antrihabitans stalactiti]NMN97886.1 MCE family protein [Antrihabitans stalactiti]